MQWDTERLGVLDARPGGPGPSAPRRRAVNASNLPLIDRVGSERGLLQMNGFYQRCEARSVHGRAYVNGNGGDRQHGEAHPRMERLMLCDGTKEQEAWQEKWASGKEQGDCWDRRGWGTSGGSVREVGWDGDLRGFTARLFESVVTRDVPIQSATETAGSLQVSESSTVASKFRSRYKFASCRVRPRTLFIFSTNFNGQRSTFYSTELPDESLSTSITTLNSIQTCLLHHSPNCAPTD